MEELLVVILMPVGSVVLINFSRTDLLQSNKVFSFGGLVEGKMKLNGPQVKHVFQRKEHVDHTQRL